MHSEMFLTDFPFSSCIRYCFVLFFALRMVNKNNFNRKFANPLGRSPNILENLQQSFPNLQGRQ